MHHVFPRSAFDSLSAEGITRAWDGLGGSHTFVTYPPLDALQSLPSSPILDQFTNVRDFSLYVHLPFCEMSCPFCPYERNVIANGENTVDEYLAALNVEMRSLGARLREANVQSLYLGGGTATVLTDAQLTLLLQSLRAEFR